MRSKIDPQMRRTRPLTNEEIQSLEKNGNQCMPGTSWTDVKVFKRAKIGAAKHIQWCRFGDKCILGHFDETRPVTVKGVLLPCGVFRSTIIDCEIHDFALIQDCVIVSRCIVREGACIVGCGSVTMVAAPKSTFANGQTLSLISDSVNRNVIIFAEMTLEDAAFIAGNPQNESEIRTWRIKAETFASNFACHCSIICQGAQVVNCPRIEDVFVGPGGHIEDATVINSCILSSSNLGADGTATGISIVKGGCFVEHSIIQWGATCDSMAFVSHSFLCMTSHVDQHAKVKQSLIGPCTRISEGEVTSSLVGCVY